MRKKILNKIRQSPAMVPKNLLWQILHKLINNICYVLLASAQDQNDSIVQQVEIDPTRIVILLRI